MKNNLLYLKSKIIEEIGKRGSCLSYKVFNKEKNKIYTTKNIPLKNKDLEDK